jgi:predicted Zn-dependent protease
MKRKVFKIFMGLTGFFLIFQINFWLPGNGGNVCALTTTEEQKLGDDVVREVEKKFSLIRDPLILEYLNGLGREILKQAGPQPYPFHFYLLKDSQLNAFSVPGGHVFITTGIIEIMNSEAELAGLLGHEITHVTHHHISSQIEKQKKIGLGAMAAALLGVLTGNPTIAAATIAGSMATAQTMFLKYSREDEEEADYLGLKFLTRAGYDRNSMITMMKKMRRLTGPAGSDPPAYLLTHPAPEQRMSELEIQMARYPSEVERRKPVGNLERIQVKLVAAEKDISRSVIYFENCLKRRPDDSEAYFGLGLAQKRMGALDRAIENLAKADSLLPDDPEISRELGTAYLLKGNLGEAEKNLQKAELLAPTDAFTHFYLGRVYLEQSLADQALPQLIRAKELNPNLPDIYYHLAQAYGEKNMLGPAYLNFAYHYKAKGDRKTALVQFQKAQTYFPENSLEGREIQREIENLTAKKGTEPPPKPQGRPNRQWKP